MKNKKFTKPTIEIVSLIDNDIIVTSFGDNGYPLEGEEWEE